MSESTIQIKVDASQGRSELRAFGADINSTVSGLERLRAFAPSQVALVALEVSHNFEARSRRHNRASPISNG